MQQLFRKRRICFRQNLKGSSADERAPTEPLSIHLDDMGLDDEARLEGGEAVTRRKLAADAGTAPDPGAMEGSLAATFPTTSKIG